MSYKLFLLPPPPPHTHTNPQNPLPNIQLWNEMAAANVIKKTSIMQRPINQHTAQKRALKKFDKLCLLWGP